MKEALQKYLELKPDGQFAQPAKELLATIGGPISTKYENPNAPKEQSQEEVGSIQPDLVGDGRRLSARPFSMLRFIAILLVAVLLISLLRSIIGMIMRGFSELISGGDSAP